MVGGKEREILMRTTTIAMTVAVTIMISIAIATKNVMKL